MAKTDKCIECGAIRIVKEDVCKRCRMENEIKVIGGAAE